MCTGLSSESVSCFIVGNESGGLVWNEKPATSRKKKEKLAEYRQWPMARYGEKYPKNGENGILGLFLVLCDFSTISGRGP